MWKSLNRLRTCVWAAAYSTNLSKWGYADTLQNTACECLCTSEQTISYAPAEIFRLLENECSLEDLATANCRRLSTVQPALGQTS